MSRIDEALKRAIGGGAPERRGITLIKDATARPAEPDVGHFPREGPVSPDGDEASSGIDLGRQTLPPASSPAVPFTALEDTIASADPGLTDRCQRLVDVLREGRAEGTLRALVVTSAVAGEGKTETVLVLASLLTRSGDRVLLIDANAHHRALHDVLGVVGEEGTGAACRSELSELPLVDLSPVLSVLIADASGAPAAAMTATGLRRLLDECAAHFDWVLVEAPPIDVHADAVAIARAVGAVVFVVGGSTPFRTAEASSAKLGRSCIVATVLHGLPSTPPAAP